MLAHLFHDLSFTTRRQQIKRAQDMDACEARFDAIAKEIIDWSLALKDPAEETLFGKDGNKARKSPSVHARSSNSNVAE